MPTTRLFSWKLPAPTSCIVEMTDFGPPLVNLPQRDRYHRSNNSGPFPCPEEIGSWTGMITPPMAMFQDLTELERAGGSCDLCSI